MPNQNQEYHLLAITKDQATIKTNHLDCYLDNKMYFVVFEKNKSVDFCLLKRNLTKLLTTNKKNLIVDLDSFLQFVPSDKQRDFVYLLVSQITNITGDNITYKSKQEIRTCQYTCHDQYKGILKNAQTIAQAVSLTKQLQIMPNNFLTVKKYLAFVQEKCQDLNAHLTIEVLDYQQVKKEKMGLLQAVNQGSNEPCAMLVLKYLNGMNKKTCGLIGKGILFDSGGYHLKPGDYQKNMHQDMSGSASVFGTIFALAATNVQANVIGFLPLTTNLVNAKSMVCHDVYYACDGQSVEILNTDAEGRLILADALAYATRKYELDSVLTIATLTGLSALCFGDLITPFWSTTSDLTKKWMEVSQKSGDYLLNIPLLPQFDQWVNESSTMADYANITKNKTCGNSTAAAFLRKFCHIPNFTHFDIAGTNEIGTSPLVALLLTMYIYVVENYEKK